LQALTSNNDSQNLEDVLNIAKVIITDRAQGALQCKALFKEAEEESEIIGLQLVKVEQEGGELVNKEDNVHSQLHSMKERSSMSF
jgi:hypothetical protein